MYCRGFTREHVLQSINECSTFPPWRRRRYAEDTVDGSLPRRFLLLLQSCWCPQMRPELGGLQSIIVASQVQDHVERGWERARPCKYLVTMTLNSEKNKYKKGMVPNLLTTQRSPHHRGWNAIILRLWTGTHLTTIVWPSILDYKPC